ncbi:MAG: glutathione S-transferase [Deltaproteobacteria bacterium]|jgi:glutathione S-transferase|nr:glutathione S-transferase [Deltaproteobacteria bacterium]MBK8718317.1 glutathione S-transferase [Deltaproteobacteria bacterium]
MTTTQPDLVFHHVPWSRSAGIRWLLEELAVPYAVNIVDVRAPQGVDEGYRAIQPHKKVPAIQHGDVVVTERAAIAIYLGDRFADAGLAPAIDAQGRAAYLTTLVYCDAVFDPAVSARAHGLTYRPSDYAFGGFDDVIAYLDAKLTRHPYAAGPVFTAADTQLASGLAFTMNVMQVVPRKPAFEAYLARTTSRPAYQRAQQLDVELLQQHPEVAKNLPQPG